MADYAALIAAWNGATQPPAGVTGTALTAQMTTAQKIAAVNGWTITGAVPTSFSVTGPQILNCVVYSEFKALTTVQQSNLLSLCAGAGAGLLVGSGNTTLLTMGLLLDLFGSGTQTRAALIALARSASTPWWQASVANGGGGLDGPVGIGYVTAAGLA